MALRPIKTEPENAAALERLAELMAASPGKGTREFDEMMVLSALIRQFEDAQYQFDKPDPIEAIRFRMEQRELKPCDMTPYFGTVSRFYEVMKGRRRLTLPMIRRLNRRLGIPAAVLIRESGRSQAKYAEGPSPALAMHDLTSAAETKAKKRAKK